ncbi:unnamed protein product, partial [Discosporangium mesarthrocarpum]
NVLQEPTGAPRCRHCKRRPGDRKCKNCRARLCDSCEAFIHPEECKKRSRKGGDASGNKTQGRLSNRENDGVYFGFTLAGLEV